MNANQGNNFLKEFKDFIVFLQSLWGLLAGISVFFPLSNVIVKVIPLANVNDVPPGELAFLPTGFVTAFTTIVALFVVLLTFGQRQRFSAKSARRSISRKASISFIVGIISIILYLFLYFGIYVFVYGPFEIWSDNPIRLMGDFLMMVTYSLFFALVTRAFMLLGMIEYFRPGKNVVGKR